LVLKDSSPHPSLPRMRGRVIETPSPASGGGKGWGL
jgi:hypothetical protein